MLFIIREPLDPSTERRLWMQITSAFLSRQELAERTLVNAQDQKDSLEDPQKWEVQAFARGEAGGTTRMRFEGWASYGQNVWLLPAFRQDFNWHYWISKFRPKVVALAAAKEFVMFSEWAWSWSCKPSSHRSVQESWNGMQSGGR